MNEQFQFDTSGEVDLPISAIYSEVRRWPDLSPGVQGCIAEVLKAATNELWIGCGGVDPALHGYEPLGFSDLHRDTLARIIADWERSSASKLSPDPATARHNAHCWWRDRQAGLDKDFPPVTIYLNDDGKVCLKDREAA